MTVCKSVFIVANGDIYNDDQFDNFVAINSFIIIPIVQVLTGVALCYLFYVQGRAKLSLQYQDDTHVTKTTFA